MTRHSDRMGELNQTILIGVDGTTKSFEVKQHLEMIVCGFPGLGRGGREPLPQKLLLAGSEQLFDLV